MEKLVSVVIPVYQSERYLKRCICSVTEQTYQNLEIILVDDGSVDGSLEICREYEARDSRIRVIHKENGGVSSARNAGLKAMSGEYLLTLDSDDYIRRDMVEKLLKTAVECRADLVICGFEYVYEDGRAGERRTPSRHFSGSLKSFAKSELLDLYDKLLLNNQNNKLYSVRMLKAHGIHSNERLSINEDLLFCFQALAHCRRVACIPECFLYYWQYSDSGSLVTRFNENGISSCFAALKAVRKFLMASGAGPELVNEMNNRMIFHICGFAGLTYYRSGYSRRVCYETVKRLSHSKVFMELLSQTRLKGVKNRTAGLLLGLRLCRIYHWLCLAVYRKKRKNEDHS